MIDDINTEYTAPIEPIPMIQPIGEAEILKAITILEKYKQGKANLERKIIDNEQWWKLRQWEGVHGVKKTTPATAWLWNTIVNKHADMMDAYPVPTFRARAGDDIEEAKRLSSVIPVVLEQADFRQTYSKCAWYKEKQGTSVYGVFWNGAKHGGMGDIEIKKVDLLNLFWESGITDIQTSRHVFHTECVDNEVLKETYPDILADVTLSGNGIAVEKYLYDDNVDTSEKSIVVDWYYHKGGKLHYCKFVNSTVLFSTENEPEKYPDGWYRHGKYPFVTDVLYEIEGSVCGYAYTDILKDEQIQIDLLSHAIVKNALVAASPKWLVRNDGGLNLQELADFDKDFIHYNGNIDDVSMRQINQSNLSGNYIAILQNKIEELKETSGNRDVSSGGTAQGVTSASGIAALIQTSGKTSRDIINTTYDAFKEVVYFVIELIRQFYDIPRQLRITGENGMDEYIQYDNSGLQQVSQGIIGGVDMGYRVPEFDIEVNAEKASPYSRLSQNELMLDFYNRGFFAPQNADQALACLKGMDFDTKDDVVNTISVNGTMYDKMMLFAQLAMTLAMRNNDQQMMTQIQQAMQSVGGLAQGMPSVMHFSDGTSTVGTANAAHMQKAREAAAEATAPI